jgi:two-component system, OmpR family, phosphate regulon response regulator PhoB
MAKERILVVEDEPDIAELLEYNLRRDGFQVEVVNDGADAVDRITDRAPDLVLLDLMLPGVDGLEICRALKQDTASREIPVIMVTARGEETDIVLGLGLGADDYITKPFSPREVLARVKAVLRRCRARSVTSTERVTHAGLVVDATRHEVLVDDDPVALTATQFRLLHLLASNAGRVFTREQLLNRVVGEHAIVTDRNVDVHVRTIRKALGPHADLIETIRGIGYRFKDR